MGERDRTPTFVYHDLSMQCNVVGAGAEAQESGVVTELKLQGEWARP